MAQILTMGDNPLQQKAFAFDHAMRHRDVLGAMAPLDRFTLIPYFVDPSTEKPFWLLVHGQAHIDFTGTLGIPTRQPLVDTNLANDEKRSWWEFVNNQEHMLAEDATVNATLTFPFW
jgi:hypothetical protein